MRKRDLERQLARQTGVSNAQAADAVDLLVSRILQQLRAGEPAVLPGFGLFHKNSDGSIQFKQEKQG